MSHINPQYINHPFSMVGPNTYPSWMKYLNYKKGRI